MNMDRTDNRTDFLNLSCKNINNNLTSAKKKRAFKYCKEMNSTFIIREESMEELLNIGLRREGMDQNRERTEYNGEQKNKKNNPFELCLDTEYIERILKSLKDSKSPLIQ